MKSNRNRNSSSKNQLVDSQVAIDKGSQNECNSSKNLYPLIIYVKQSYSLPGFSIQTPCVSCESLATVIDLNNNPMDFRESSYPLKPLCACPISHEILMLISLKQSILGGDQRFPFDIKLVNPTKMLPEELRCRMVRNLPVMVDPNNNGHILENRMDLVEYLQERYPTRQLDFPKEQCPSEMNWQLISAIHSVSCRFYLYVQQHYQPLKNYYSNKITNIEIQQQLISSLGTLNRILSNFETQYAVTNDYPTLLDCHLMPRLHQIRVLLAYLDHVQIPDSYRRLWQYITEAYHMAEFRRWCPSDQEIVLHWMMKTNYRIINPKSYRSSMMKLIRSQPTYNFQCAIYEDQVTRL